MFKRSWIEMTNVLTQATSRPISVFKEVARNERLVHLSVKLTRRWIQHSSLLLARSPGHNPPSNWLKKLHSFPLVNSPSFSLIDSHLSHLHFFFFTLQSHSLCVRLNWWAPRYASLRPGTEEREREKTSLWMNHDVNHTLSGQCEIFVALLLAYSESGLKIPSCVATTSATFMTKVPSAAPPAVSLRRLFFLSHRFTASMHNWKPLSDEWLFVFS